MHNDEQENSPKVVDKAENLHNCRSPVSASKLVEEAIIGEAIPTGLQNCHVTDIFIAKEMPTVWDYIVSKEDEEDSCQDKGLLPTTPDYITYEGAKDDAEDKETDVESREEADDYFVSNDDVEGDEVDDRELTREKVSLFF